MNNPEINERQPQDFLYRVVTAAVFIVLFVMVVLFIASFIVQQRWVFAKQK